MATTTELRIVSTPSNAAAQLGDEEV